MQFHIIFKMTSSWLLPPVSILVVTITSPNTPLVAGQSYTLYCNGMVLGNTSFTPQVTWSNPNGVVNSIALSNGSLTFNPLHTSHGGKYTCQSALSFPFSSTSADINIIVQSTFSLSLREAESTLILSPSPQSLLPLSPSHPHLSLPHTMLVHHSTSPALFSSSHKWTLLSSLTPCGLDQEDRSPVVLVESHSPLVSTRPLYSSFLSTPLILECTTVQLMFLHQVSSMWTPQ